MQPRLYMQSFQYATYNAHCGKVTFETRHIGGRRFHFNLTKNQLFALDDAIQLIDRDKAWGHFPLGHNVWFHYSKSTVSLYKEKENGRVYFQFSSFKEYKTVTHRRLLSLIRLKGETTGRERRSTDARRHNNGRARGRQRGCEVKSTSYKRSLSSTVQPADRPLSAKRYRGEEWKTASRSSINADVSHDGEKSSIFPKWKCSNPRRRSDSFSSVSSISKSALSLDEVQLEPCNTPDPMESE